MNKTSSAIVRTLLLGTSCLSILGLGTAGAQPTGGAVVLGTASITNKGANNTVIDQKTGKAIINWDSFSIAAGGTVRFNQPGASSITLNRVLGSESSSIMGNLLANGQVWIINQNGILFGAGSRINVGGLIATTSDIANGDFSSGNYSFSGGTGASVVNQGNIRTRNGGAVVLSGASAQNQGLIQADTGTVVLGGASAFTVDFTGDGLLKYAITAPSGKADNGQTGASNSGTISAAGGRVIMTARAAANVADAVVNNTGMISATSAKVANGEVILDGGDGDVNAGGTIDASGTGRGQTGGSVSITGHNVTVADNATIDVSGDAGGGSVRIGGDLHGAGPLQNAANTHVGHAVIRADATRTGNGGTLVVWSNGLTDFSGIFSAKGGLMGGNGGFLETSGHKLTVSPDARIDTTAPKGQTGTWLLDPDTIVISSGEGAGTALDGSGRLGLGTDPGLTDTIDPATIVAALATTNVTLEAATMIEVDSDVIYASPHSLSLMSEGNIFAFASIQNTQASGGGAINLVAGWDGVTAAGAILTTAGSYGADDGEGGRGDILFDGSYGNVFIGSASGATTVAGFQMVLAAEDSGNAQLGFHGAGGGDINVYMTDSLGLLGQSPFANGHYAMIGNGALDGSVSGQVTGNIFVSLANFLELQTVSCDCAQSGFVPTIGLGNAGAPGDVLPTGHVVLIGKDVQDQYDDNGGFGRIVTTDLAYGDVTVGRIDPTTALQIGEDLAYSSAHSLTLLSVGDIEIDANVRNDGTGAITLVAGWDGIYDPSRIGLTGTYGNNNGSVNVGGANAAGFASIGAAHGALDIYASSLNLSPTNANVQVGYHGAGGGDINVKVTQNINGFGNATNPYSLQLGNGTLTDDVQGNITGNIHLDAGGQTVFFSSVGRGWLGNHAAAGFKEVGNVTSLSASGSYAADYIEADLGTSPDTGGDVFLGFRGDPAALGFRVGGIEYNSPHSFVFATMASLDVIGDVINGGSGDVTLVSGWDGATVGSAAQIRAAGAYGLNGTHTNIGGNHSYTIGDFSFTNNQFQDVSVGSAGGLTTILTGDLTIAPATGYYAQLGYHGPGGGAVSVVVRGDLALTGGATAHDYAMIGNGSLNGDVTGAVTGNIDIRVTGQTHLEGDAAFDNAWIGSRSLAGGNSGNLVFVSGDFFAQGPTGAMIASDLAIGDVTFALTDPVDRSIAGDVLYNSAHTLNLLFVGTTEIVSRVQNAGTGAINVVTGWDGHTLDPAHFLDDGVFGNGGQPLLIGSSSAPGNAAIGSAGGKTTIATGNLVIIGVNGAAQLGFQGNGTGAIVVDSTGVIFLSGASTQDYAEIGNGSVFGSNSGSGAVSLTTYNFVPDVNSAITASALDITSVGPIGSSAQPLRVATGTLALRNQGYEAYISSPNNGVTLAGVNLNGGSLFLTAGGAIGQTAAILASQINIATTTGAINLSNAGNNFGTLSVGTVGANAATVFDSRALVVAGAAVGGTLTLSANGAITQSGAIGAGTLSVSTTTGAITLTNSGNSFASLGVTTAGADAASIYDSSAVAVTGATVGGGFTLSAGGAIGQSGAISAATLNVSATGGAIALTNSGNSFASLTVATAGSNGASIADSRALVVSGATVGGTFTLSTAGAITQTGAITAGGLGATTSTGAITLTNSGNAFGTLAVTTAGSDSATVFDTTAVAVTGASVGGTFALTAGGAISQSGAIVANVLNVSTTAGGITLTNSGNGFNTLSVTTTGTNGASLFDSRAVVVASAAVGGTFTLTAGGAISQSAAIAAGSLNFSTTAGAIALANAANQVAGNVAFNGAAAVTFYNSVTTNLAATAAGGDLTLLSKGNINFLGSVQSGTGAIVAVAGWNGTTTDPSQFGNSGVFGNNAGNITVGGTGTTAAVAVGSKSGSTSFYAAQVNIAGANANAQLGYHGTGGGAIKVVASGNVNIAAGSGSAMLGNGSLASDVTGNITGDIDVRAGGVLAFAGSAIQFGNMAHSGSETGNLILVASNTTGADTQFGTFIANALSGGDVTLGYTGPGDQGPNQDYAVNSSHTLNLLSAGNFVIGGALQNAGTGAINVVAGWDGKTLSQSSFGTAGVFGNNGKGVTIGGANAAGNAALGSAGGTTSIYGASLAVSAVHGYAQLGFNGHGTGAIVVNVTGGVAVTGGATAGQFAQIGNGGLKASGSNFGDILITAGGDLVLTGGAGAESYAQVGHGGAESNTGANGYTNQAAITLTAANVLLNAGDGTGAYVQIGHGGLKSGINLAGGTANNSGAITITSGHAVSLIGKGADAYAQIGNGGSQSNLNAAASAGGTDSGDIVVHAPNGPAGAVTVHAGAGANAYAQIGNGGYAVNSGPTSTAANWTITGNLAVTDLALTGGDTGGNAFALIGNGDASRSSTGNVSGNILIDANGQITYVAGKAPKSPATIGNFTGLGTVSGTLTGAQPPSDVTTDPVVIGVVSVNTADTNNNDGNHEITTINTVVVPEAQETSGGAAQLTATLVPEPSGSIASLDNGGDSSEPNTSDNATTVIADSLDGTKKAGSQTILAGMLKQSLATTAAHTVHGVPPADQDFSSWGNEALWQ